MSRVRSFTIAGVVAGVFALAVACSSGSGGGSASTNSDADGLKKATKSFAEAVLSGDPGSAYKYLTTDCQKKISQDKFKSTIKQAIALVKSFAGKNGKNLSVGKVETRNVKNDKGESRAAILGSNGRTLPGSSTWDKWKYQSGGWRTSSCDFTGSVSTSSDSTDSADFSTSFSDFSDLSSLDSQLSEFSDSFGSLFSNS